LATDVFIGRVVASPYRRDADGMVHRDPKTPASLYALFAVQTRFKGRALDEMAATPQCGLNCEDSCQVAFVEGDTYFVNGVVRDGRLVVSQGDNPLLLSGATNEITQREMAEVRKYLENLASGRQQAFVHGYLYFLEQPEAVTTSEVVVRARRIADGLATTVRVPNRGAAFHGYQIVIAPGEYEISVIRNGAPVSPTVRVDAAERDVLRLTFDSAGGYCVGRQSEPVDAIRCERPARQDRAR
jgi:hypothetical protein